MIVHCEHWKTYQSDHISLADRNLNDNLKRNRLFPLQQVTNPFCLLLLQTLISKYSDLEVQARNGQTRAF